jgi:hypothetical protein
MIIFLGHNSNLNQVCAAVVEFVDTRDSKSREGNLMSVQVRPAVPNGIILSNVSLRVHPFLCLRQLLDNAVSGALIDYFLNFQVFVATHHNKVVLVFADLFPLFDG